MPLPCGVNGEAFVAFWDVVTKNIHRVLDICFKLDTTRRKGFGLGVNSDYLYGGTSAGRS
jgi:hypothetical protein